MKRITWWPQAWLGLVFSWGALVGWPAVTGSLRLAGVAALVRSIAWVIGYDTLYAIQDIEDDALVGVKSSARRLGDKAPLGVGALLRIAVILWGAAIWRSGPTGWRCSRWFRLRSSCQPGSARRSQGWRAGTAAVPLESTCGLLVFLAMLVVGLSAARRADAIPRRRREIAESLVERGIAAGATAADALYIGDRSSGVQVRLGELEDVSRSEGEEIGLRLFSGHRSATVASSDLSEEALGCWSSAAWRWHERLPRIPMRAWLPRNFLLAEICLSSTRRIRRT